MAGTPDQPKTTWTDQWTRQICAYSTRSALDRGYTCSGGKTAWPYKHKEGSEEGGSSQSHGIGIPLSVLTPRNTVDKKVVSGVLSNRHPLNKTKPTGHTAQDYGTHQTKSCKRQTRTPRPTRRRNQATTGHQMPNRKAHEPGKRQITENYEGTQAPKPLASRLRTQTSKWKQISTVEQMTAHHQRTLPPET